MSQITRIEMWRDVGFQEGAVEVPSKDDHLALLPASDDELGYLRIEYDDGIRTSTEDFFSAFTIPMAFSDDILSYSYLRVTYSYNNINTPQTFYGWIDDVALKSDSDGSPAIRVTWHIDMWRSYFSQAHFGYGLVQGRPASDDDPPQSCSHRYRLAGDFRSLIPDVVGGDVNWLVFTYTKEINEGDTHETAVRTCAIPVDKSNLDVDFNVSDGTTNKAVPRFAQIASGKLPEAFGISAQQITSAFISPIPPFEIERRDGGTFYVKTHATGESTERRTASVSDTETRRVVSMSSTYQSNQNTVTLKVNFSDGTTSSAPFLATAQGGATLKMVLDALNGIVSANPYIHVNTISYQVKVADLVASAMPDMSFADGDTVTIRNVTTSRTTNLSLDTSSNEFTYTLAHGSLSDLTFTYNGGWPDTVVYSPDRIQGTVSYTVSASTYSVQVEDAGLTIGKGYIYTRSQNFAEYPVDLHGAVTTDTSELVVTDMSGSPVASVPWGYPLREGTVRLVVSAVSAYLQFRFNGLYSSPDGVEFTVPLPPVDICSNSFVDYVYSGQREYDIEQRRIASEQALVGSITSAVGGSASNIIMSQIGSSKTRASPRELGEVAMGMPYEKLKAIGMNPGAQGLSGTTTRGMTPLTALGATIGMSALGSVADYALAQMYNGQLQHAEDTLRAKQFDTITIPSNGWDWLWHGRSVGIVSLVPDDYSLEVFRRDRELNGVFCSEPTEDCSDLIGEGPYRIAELIVTGPIPPRARAYIRGRFANGVRIKTINQPEDTTTGTAGPAPDITRGD